MRVKMDFQGGALALFGYTLLAGILAYFFIVPLAWGYAMLFGFIAANTRLSDGNYVQFVGKGGEIWWIVLFAILPFFFPMLTLIGMKQGDQPPPLYFILLVLAIPVSLYFSFLLMRWMIGSIVFGWGGRLTFNGGFLGMLGWMLLTYVSAILIILPFWVMSAFIRWTCENTSSSTGDRLIWTGSGWGLLWRMFVLYLTSIFIIPIPWMMKWFTHWMIEHIEIERAGVAQVQYPNPQYPQYQQAPPGAPLPQ
ncbi:MAG TPA: hypothetical protein VM658_22300 [bacterium]|nr:hypothetical protein [bacterium]